MLKILLVEDEIRNRDILARRLTNRGYQVVTATNGVEACASAQAEKPDLILMDVRMPEMNGWEATRIIKGDPQTASIRVILLTGDVMPGEREKALQFGCDDFHGKPVDFARLLEQIETALKKGSTS